MSLGLSSPECGPTSPGSSHSSPSPPAVVPTAYNLIILKELPLTLGMTTHTEQKPNDAMKVIFLNFLFD